MVGEHRWVEGAALKGPGTTGEQEQQHMREQTDEVRTTLRLMTTNRERKPGERMSTQKGTV